MEATQRGKKMTEPCLFRTSVLPLSLLVTVQTLSRAPRTTRGGPSLTDVATLQRRSSDRRSCAGGSLLAPGCCDADCVGCRCESGGARGDGCVVGGGRCVLGWCSKGSATPGDERTKLKDKKKRKE